MARAMAVVLFTDLVGSTELRGRLGEEAAEELRRRHDRLLTKAVEAHSGRVVKGLGDGIMATLPFRASPSPAIQIRSRVGHTGMAASRYPADTNLSRSGPGMPMPAPRSFSSPRLLS